MSLAWVVARAVQKSAGLAMSACATRSRIDVGISSRRTPTWLVIVTSTSAPGSGAGPPLLLVPPVPLLALDDPLPPPHAGAR